MSAKPTTNQTHSTTAAEVPPSPASAATGWPQQRSHGRHVAHNGVCDCAKDSTGMSSGFVLKHRLGCPFATYDEQRHARARAVLLFRMISLSIGAVNCQTMLDQYPRAFANGDLLNQVTELESDVAALRAKIEARASLSGVA